MTEHDEIPLEWIREGQSITPDEQVRFAQSRCTSPEQARALLEILQAAESDDFPALEPETSLAGSFRLYLEARGRELRASGLSDEECREAIEMLRDTVRATRRRMLRRDPRENRPGYGLVMGRIQSGKTAHLIGVALHSLDESENNQPPCDTVIILSGLIEDLRIQTRHRVDRSLAGFENPQLVFPGGDSDISSNDTEGLAVISDHFRPDSREKKIFVIKKNHLVLEALVGEIPRDLRTLRRRRVLIIDDEADHASIDNNREANLDVVGEEIDEDPSRTNLLLRQLINRFRHSQSCWYIGYTATPFANLLIHPHSSDIEDDNGLSLFPRDMLHSLPRNRGHRDNETYFGRPNSPHVVVVTAPVEGSPLERRNATELLLRHVVTQKIKSQRELGHHHTTMIHTNVETDEHCRFAILMRERIDYAMNEANATEILQEALRILRQYPISEEERDEVAAALHDMITADFISWIDFIDNITVIEVNARRREAGEDQLRDLNYSGEPKSYIAIGGTRLSRGLTLEGLTTSWFTRTAQRPNYDTMMQMSRWSGYRPGYEDLVRIYTTSEIRDHFTNICSVEEEVRDRVEALPEDQNPMATAIWIREHPGLEVTRPTAMVGVRHRGHGTLYRPALWTHHPPYFQGSYSGEVVGAVNRSLLSLIRSIGGEGEFGNPPRGGTFAFTEGVDRTLVRRFVGSFNSFYGEEGENITSLELASLLSEWPSSEIWNVAIHTPGNVSNFESIGGLRIGMVQRTPEHERFAIIQTRESDKRLDLEQGERRVTPLLLVYLVDPNSTRRSNDRVFDDSVTMGAPMFGVVLPEDDRPRGYTEVMHGGDLEEET